MTSPPVDSTTQATFDWWVRVYYEDTDAGGVVYHANYLGFAERARTEWLRHLGIPPSYLASAHELLFAVRRIEVTFERPARLDDRVQVRTTLERIGRASLDFDQQLSIQSLETEEPVAACRLAVNIACLDTARWRPRPIPELLHEVFRRAP
jgi:acyl-CoA thioester hydrolase